MSGDNQLACLAVLNVSAEGIKRLGEAIAPVLGTILTVLQIGIAVVTVLWVLQRWKGAKLDNKLKQRELEKK